MRKLIRFLDRVLTPVLTLGYLALCLILLALSPSLGAFLAMVWGACMMAALRWGIWGILMLARKQTRDRSVLKVLVRTVEGIQVLLILFAITLAILLRQVPTASLLVPAAFCGLRGAVRFDAEWL